MEVVAVLVQEASVFVGGTRTLVTAFLSELKDSLARDFGRAGRDFESVDVRGIRAVLT